MNDSILLRKLRETIQAHELIKRGDTVVVGVSGGPDSLTLLHALRILAPEWELKLHVAHLNHQLRGADADVDEQFVLWLAREWGLPVASAQWDVRGYAEEGGLSIEEAARNLRYQFLLGVAKQVNANAIAVAHNADDQVETILLHFLRGAGLTGLRGMEYESSIQSSVVSHQNRLIRPLLDVTRDEIEAYCEENGLEPRRDESNLDTTILRNRLRHEVIPYLENINPNLREVIRHSALSVADDYAYIQQNVLGIFDRMTRSSEDAFVFDRKWFRALPVNLQRGVLREAVSRLRRLKNIGYMHIENARRVAVEREPGTEATLPQGLRLVVGYDDFALGGHIPPPDAPLLFNDETIALQVGSEVMLEGSSWGVRVVERGGGVEQRTFDGERAETTERWVAEFDAEKVQGQLVLRTRRAGERFAPKGMGGKRKSLHEFMIDEKIPRHLREFVPILADEERVLWVVGYRQGESSAVRLGDERASVKDTTEKVMRVQFFKNLE